MCFITFCCGVFRYMPWFFAGKRRLLTSIPAGHKKTDSRAAHKALIACFLLSCITQTITHVQCTRNSSCAVHQCWLACSPFHVTRVFWFETWQKLKNTCVFTACECQLRCKLYCMRYEGSAAKQNHWQDFKIFLFLYCPRFQDFNQDVGLISIKTSGFWSDFKIWKEIPRDDSMLILLQICTFLLKILNWV